MALDFETAKAVAAFGGFIIAIVNFCYSICYKEFLLQPILKGRIISIVYISPEMMFNYDNFGVHKQIKGIGYALKLSITASNKAFNIKQIRMNFRYKNDSNLYEGLIYTNPRLSLSLIDGKKKDLCIPNSELLPFLNVLEKDKNNVCYVTCIVEKPINEETKRKLDFKISESNPKQILLQTELFLFSEVEIFFYDYDNNCKSLTLKQKDIDPKLQFYEERLWVDMGDAH
ncbi:hypothetical protein [Coleofasciculus sp. H7-2]|uniref:hypothetical protein n=1 Tax=Coleofasciculus sp. H7-2 TaxID=3351545 RepID=UPI00366B2560